MTYKPLQRFCHLSYLKYTIRTIFLFLFFPFLCPSVKQQGEAEILNPVVPFNKLSQIHMLTTLIIILLTRSPKIRLMFGIKTEPVKIKEMRAVRILVIKKKQFFLRNGRIKQLALMEE